jgi:nucleoside-diphosphate-sugar epimerase
LHHRATRAQMTAGLYSSLDERRGSGHEGTPRKLVDISRLSALGWKARISLREGIGEAYADFLTKRVREK